MFAQCWFNAGPHYVTLTFIQHWSNGLYQLWRYLSVSPLKWRLLQDYQRNIMFLTKQCPNIERRETWYFSKRHVKTLQRSYRVLQPHGGTPDEHSLNVLYDGRSLEVGGGSRWKRRQANEGRWKSSERPPSALIKSMYRSCCALPAFIGVHSPFSWDDCTLTKDGRMKVVKNGWRMAGERCKRQYERWLHRRYMNVQPSAQKYIFTNAARALDKNVVVWQGKCPVTQQRLVQRFCIVGFLCTSSQFKLRHVLC